MTFKEEWLKLIRDLYFGGQPFSPRGQKTLELEDYMFNLDTRNMFCNFKERKLSTKYLVAELAWYLNGDPNDMRMEHYASMWGNIKNQDAPFFHSNYGEYIFRENQFDYCLQQLKADKDTRQACIIINRPNVMMSPTKDKICTYAINFRIRNDKLNMSVCMRSNDIIFGATIDVFQFLVIYDMMFVCLQDSYENLKRGRYNHKADSFHVYERHFKMLESILDENNGSSSSFTEIDCPEIYSAGEAGFLKEWLPDFEERIRIGKIEANHLFNVIPVEYKFTWWCVEQLLKK